MERYLMHHGVQGQKWGVRRWQRADGTLTPEGRAHYGLTTRVLPNGDVLPVNFDASRGKDTYGVLGKKEESLLLDILERISTLKKKTSVTTS